jgi:hypothetical protein
VGSRLSRSTERRKWLNDCRKEEYKELVTTLTDAGLSLIQFHGPTGEQLSDAKPETIWEYRELRYKSLRVLKDRIFIADEVRQMKIYERWCMASNKVTGKEQLTEFESAWDAILSDLIKAAQKTK